MLCLSGFELYSRWMPLIHRCLDLVRSNRRYGTAHNPVTYFARSKSRLREWKTFDPEVHALEILFGNLPHQMSTINFKLFMFSKWKKKVVQLARKANWTYCGQSMSVNAMQC